MDPLFILIAVLILCAVYYLVMYVIVPRVPQPMQNVVVIVFAVLVIYVLLSYFIPGARLWK